MRKRSPSVALIWMYQGKNPAERRAEIEQLLSQLHGRRGHPGYSGEYGSLRFLDG